jgi:hypothetical protein
MNDLTPPYEDRPQQRRSNGRRPAWKALIAGGILAAAISVAGIASSADVAVGHPAQTRFEGRLAGIHLAGTLKSLDADHAPHAAAPQPASHGAPRGTGR